MTSDAESSEEEWEDVEETRKSADDESENVEVRNLLSRDLSTDQRIQLN